MNKGNRRDEGSESNLSVAAQALDVELRRYAELAAEVHRVPLNSEKNLGRAAKALKDAAAAQERIGAFVAALVSAISESRDAQQTTAEKLFERAQEIQRRVLTLESLAQRFAQLGADAKAMNALMQEAAESSVPDGAPPETSAARAAELAARLGGVDERMGTTIEEAAALVADATASTMDDIALGADGIRQKLQSARNKLRLLTKNFAPIGVA